MPMLIMPSKLDHIILGISCAPWGQSS